MTSSNGWQRSMHGEGFEVCVKGEIGLGLADKLTQLRKLSGDPLELIINVEVQGTPIADLAKRMFTYNYRAYDRFGRPVVSIAVLCDDSQSFQGA